MKELITFPAPYFFSRLKMIYRGFSVKKKKKTKQKQEQQKQKNLLNYSSATKDMTAAELLMVSPVTERNREEQGTETSG